MARVLRLERGAISIHASRGGSDRQSHIHSSCKSNFNPRFPRGKRPVKRPPPPEPTPISIHASRGGSDTCTAPGTSGTTISIHASRGGSDRQSHIHSSCKSNFNPRFPRGKRLPQALRCLWSANFNPRFPRGKRLDLSRGGHGRQHYFNPRFPRGKRLYGLCCVGWF